MAAARGFATVARDEVAGERPTGSLLTAVNETIRPRQVTLWLVAKGGGRTEA